MMQQIKLKPIKTYIFHPDTSPNLCISLINILIKEQTMPVLIGVRSVRQKTMVVRYRAMVVPGVGGVLVLV